MRDIQFGDEHIKVLSYFSQKVEICKCRNIIFGGVLLYILRTEKRWIA